MHFKTIAAVCAWPAQSDFHFARGGSLQSTGRESKLEPIQQLKLGTICMLMPFLHFTGEQESCSPKTDCCRASTLLLGMDFLLSL
eukprot:2865238-Amphidinium_carterae.1